MHKQPNRNTIEYKVGLHFHKQGYKVRFSDYDNDGNIDVLLKKEDVRRVVRIQYYENKNEEHMRNHVRALQSGLIGQDYFITNDTPKNGSVHIQTIHLLGKYLPSDHVLMNQLFFG